jgi:hypothetical protein
MRVIRTGLYFNDVESEYRSLRQMLLGRASSAKNRNIDYNVDFAWFNLSNEGLGSGDFILNAPRDSFTEPFIADAKDRVPRFLDIVVQGSERRNFKNRILAERVVNREIVESILDSPIIIERLPQEAITFASILKGASSVTIGLIRVATGHYPLMFVAIPMGVIVVGSAIGITKGLQNGLQKEVEGHRKTF